MCDLGITKVTYKVSYYLANSQPVKTVQHEIQLHKTYQHYMHPQSPRPLVVLMIHFY